MIFPKSIYWCHAHASWACTRQKLILLAAAVCMVFCCGCGMPPAVGKADSYEQDLTPPVGVEPYGAVVFMVDGVNADIFNEMLKKGELPSINKYLVSRGAYASHALASTPSITLANETALTTGCLPGNNNIPSVTWFDRKALVWRNYATVDQKNMLDDDHKKPTIFEQFPDDFTVSIFYQSHRGTTKFFQNWQSAGPPYFFGMFDVVDRLTLYRTGEMMRMSRQMGKFPRLVYIYLLMPDFMGYNHGINSPDYRQALKHTDYQLGRLFGDMERAGWMKGVYFVFVSDHGLVEVTKHFHVDDFLHDTLKLDVAHKHRREKHPLAERQAYYNQFPCVTYGNGDRFWAISLRKPSATPGKYEPWDIRPNEADMRNYANLANQRVDVIARLLAEPAVDVVSWAGENGEVNVATRGGQVSFNQPQGNGGDIEYKIIHGTDPLGWSRYEIASGEKHSPRDWVKRTYKTTYPGLPVDICAYFRCERRGDIALFAVPGYDFNTVHRAGHGGLRPGEMLVPLIIAGPGIAPQTIEYARTIDIVPTILKLLNKPAMQVDGEALPIKETNP